MINGIVFDKDGTLFDFNATWGSWTCDMLRAEAGNDPALLAQMAELLGYDLAQGQFRQGSIVIAETVGVVADALLTLLPGRDKTALIADMKAAATQVPQVESTPLVAYFQNLRVAGLRTGVVTNDAEDPARAHLARAGITDLVDFVAGYDSGHGAKPAPGPILAFCTATGVAPDTCLMVGDSTHDLHAGRAAGMRTVGVLTGPALADELAPHADIILPSIADIPAWMQQVGIWPG